MSEAEVTEDQKIDPRDVAVAEYAFSVLDRHYPGHAWFIHVDGKQGIIIVRNQMLSNHWGYVIRSNDLISATDFDKKLVTAGGEILERFSLARGKFDGEMWAGLPVSAAGIPEFYKD
jgi:hypothetical protein